MNRLKFLFLGLLCGIYASNSFAQMPLHLAKGSGSFRLGVVCGNESRWLDQCKVKTKGQTSTIKDPLLKGGEIIMTICPLTDSEGFIIEVSGSQLPEASQLAWTFGACDGKETEKGKEIQPSACHHNVFSIEGNAFSTYYGESMALRVTRGVTPSGEEIRLCDAHQQDTPLRLYESGKKTDAPVIAALCPMKKQEKLYFCLFKQNAKADYNYFMLPELFAKEKTK